MKQLGSLILKLGLENIFIDGPGFNPLFVTRQENCKTQLWALSGISQKAFLSSLSITRTVIQIHKWVRNCNVSIEFIVQYCTQSVLLKAVEFQ